MCTEMATAERPLTRKLPRRNAVVGWRDAGRIFGVAMNLVLPRAGALRISIRHVWSSAG
jgi:hypothetical protein